jgi:nitrile hydratase accessory protein
MTIDRSIAYLEGAAALPRKNGELVFHAPWEGRAFGMAVVLSDRGEYEWDSFRSRLVEQIGQSGKSYYENWLAALESVLVARGIVTAAQVKRRAAEYAALKRDPVF